MTENHSDIIEFVLNRRIKRINFKQEKLSPTTTLLQYLRKLPECRGTKEGCAEGDCGACTVVLAEVTHEGKLLYSAVNSCLIFLPAIHGKQVITIEDLDQEGQMHPIQETFYQHNASQCGYCTPGFIMALYALHKTNARFDNESIRYKLAGNLCRCTGYRSIIDAAAEGLAISKNTSIFSDENHIIDQLQRIKSQETEISIDSNNQEYFLPSSLSNALLIKKNKPHALIVSGGTDVALRVTKNHEELPAILDLSAIEELKTFRENKVHISIGAGLNLNAIRKLLKNRFPAIDTMIHYFGSEQIRNLATLGGNIGSASPIGDSLPVLMVHKAKVVVNSKDGTRTIDLEDFITAYRKTLLSKQEIIKQIILPVDQQDNAVHVSFYKNSKRRHLDISSVSAAFRLAISADKIAEIMIVYGGMAATPVRAIKTEKFLSGKIWSLKTVEKAATILSEEFLPISDARADVEGRRIMAVNLLKKFWFDLSKKLGDE